MTSRWPFHTPAVIDRPAFQCRPPFVGELSAVSNIYSRGASAQFGAAVTSLQTRRTQKNFVSAPPFQSLDAAKYLNYLSRNDSGSYRPRHWAKQQVIYSKLRFALLTSPSPHYRLLFRFPTELKKKESHCIQSSKANWHLSSPSRRCRSRSVSDSSRLKSVGVSCHWCMFATHSSVFTAIMCYNLLGMLSNELTWSRFGMCAKWVSPSELTLIVENWFCVWNAKRSFTVQTIKTDMLWLNCSISFFFFFPSKK